MMTSGQRIRVAASILFFSCIGLNGCAPSTTTASTTRVLRPQQVTVADFSRASSNSAAATPESSRPAGSTQPTAAEGPSTTAAATKPASSAGSPALTIRTGQPVIIDSLIGQVSGRPIFADSLLEPIADQLRRQREQLSQSEFVRKAKEIVDQRLLEMVRNELFLAEAEASLTEQQQQGLLAFLNNFREKTLAESLGSLSRRQQELQQEEGMTVDQFVELERNQLLIGTLINQKINPRVLVSWKDIEREYERRKAEFNPPATVTLKILKLSNIDRKDDIEQVKQRLAAGESFDAVTTSMSLRASTPGPQTTPSGDPGDASGILEAYKPHLKGLQEGQTTEAFIVKDATRDDTVWIHVEKIDHPPARTLYDVQRELANELTIRRGDEERARYIKSLFDKGIYSELDEMSRRVLTVALVRYGQ